MEYKRYKILVLSDLKTSSEKQIESVVNFTSRINADIEFFHVKKPEDIVEKENQLNAIRDIKDEHKLIDKQLKKITSYISTDYNVTYKFAFGNVKNEIEKYIEKSKPDVIVLGKRKLKSLGLIGDKITRFVLKNYTGGIFISSDESTFNSKKELSLGILNHFEKTLELTERLIGGSKKPLKSFKIVDNVSPHQQKTSLAQTEVIEYVFEKKDDTVKKLSDYLLKSNIDLFCISRNDSNNETPIKTTEIEYMINNYNVPLFITG